MSDIDVDQAKLELDRERLEIERVRAKREGLFLNRHFPTIVTLILTLGASFISWNQTKIADDERRTEKLRAQAVEEREWRFRIMEFVKKNDQVIFSPKEEDRNRASMLLQVGLPPEQAQDLIWRLNAIAPTPDDAITWVQARTQVAAARAPTAVGSVRAAPTVPETAPFRVFLHYQDPNDRWDFMRVLSKALANAGYHVPPPQERVSADTKGDVRYYRESERGDAEAVRKIVDRTLAKNQRPPTAQMISFEDRIQNLPERTCEVWIPRVPDRQNELDTHGADRKVEAQGPR